MRLDDLVSLPLALFFVVKRANCATQPAPDPSAAFQTWISSLDWMLMLSLKRACFTAPQELVLRKAGVVDSWFASRLAWMEDRRCYPRDETGEAMRPRSPNEEVIRGKLVKDLEGSGVVGLEEDIFEELVHPLAERDTHYP